MKGMLESQMKDKLSPEGVQDMLKGGGATKETAPTSSQDKAKGMLKGLFGK
jgi:hypothetical protein